MSLNRFIVSLIMGVIVSWGGGCSSPTSSTAVAYNRVQPAAVEILVNGRMAGSGSIVDDNGSVLIAAHMLPGSDATIEAHSRTLGRYPVRLIAVDRAHDLALLQLPERDTAWPHLSIAQKAPQAGERVFVFGAPVFRHEVMLAGTVARSQPTFEFYDGAFREIMHITAISPIGTSGGPWVNTRGEIFGVQSAAMTIKGGHQGVAYAAPLSAIRKLLIKKQTIQATTLQTGLEELWSQSPSLLNKLPKDFRGLVVRQLQGNGVAAKAGLKEWDLIVSVNGKLYERTEELMRFIRSKKPGDTLQIEATDREGKNLRELFVKLTSIP